MKLNISTKNFFFILAGLSLVLSIYSFHPTLDIPLSPEDLSVYLGYFHFTGDFNIPRCFYWNSFGVLPGEFVYKYGFDIKDLGGSYRPLSTVLFALNFIISGFNPTSYHITNILLHLITSLLVGYLVILMTKRYGLAAFAAIFFLLNPLHAEQTMVIIHISDILCTLFYTLGFIFFWHYMASEKRKFLILSIISFLFTIMSKEMCVTFPVILTISYLLLFKKFQFNLGYFIDALKKLGIFWLLLGCYIVFRILIFGSIGGYPGIYASHDNPVSPHVKIGWFMAENIAEGINKLFLIPGESLPSRYMWMLLLLLPLILPVSRKLKVAILWIFISVAPISNLYLMSWYLYLPSVGFTAAITIAIGLIIDFVQKRTRWKYQEREQFDFISWHKNPFVIVSIIFSIVLFSLFNNRIRIKTENYRNSAEYSFIVKDAFKKLKLDFPKGSNIYLLVNSITETDNKVDYNPALQYVMRIAYNDLYQNLVPIPINLESDYFLELNKAAILDMTSISIDDKTFFFDYTTWNLTERQDILEVFKLREDLKKSKVKGIPFFSYDFSLENQFDSWKTYPEGDSLISSKGHVVNKSSIAIDLRSPFGSLDSLFVEKIFVRLNVKSQGPTKGYFYWKNKGDGDYSENKKRTFDLDNNDGIKTIEIPLAKDISWIIYRDVSEMRLLFDPKVQEVTIEKIELN